MLTALEERTLGSLTILAPVSEPQELVTDTGRLWQWTGDGGPLLGLVVAIGEQQTIDLAQPMLEGVLNQHLEILRTEQADHPDDVEIARLDLEVPGAACTAAASVKASRVGHDTTSTVVMMSDGHHLHITVELLTLASRYGQEYVEGILPSLLVTAGA